MNSNNNGKVHESAQERSVNTPEVQAIQVGKASVRGPDPQVVTHLMATCVGLPIRIRKLLTDKSPLEAHITAILVILLVGYTVRKTVLGGFDIRIILEQFFMEGMAVAFFSLVAANLPGRSLVQQAFGTPIEKRQSLVTSAHVATYLFFWGHLTTALFEVFRRMTSSSEGGWKAAMNDFRLVDDFAFPIGVTLSALLLIVPVSWFYLKDVLLALWLFLVKTLAALILVAGAGLLIYISIMVSTIVGGFILGLIP